MSFSAKSKQKNVSFQSNAIPSNEKKKQIDTNLENKPSSLNRPKPNLSEFESLYDDYLISELMKMNAKRNCNITCEQINKEVKEMWTAVEALRGEVMGLHDTNEANKKMLDFYDSAMSESSSVDLHIRKDLPEMSVDLEDLARALEQTRHHLKVLGAKVDQEDDNEEALLRILKEIYSSLLASQSKSNGETEVLSNCAAQAHELNMDFDNCIVAFHRCKELLKKLKSATLHATSLALSKRSLEEPDGDSFDPCNIKCAMEDDENTIN